MQNLIKFTIIIILLSQSSTVFSQVLKVNNGISISSVKSKKVDMLSKSMSAYSFSLGVDYLEKEHFYLSSEIGYLKKGGKEENEYLPEPYTNVKETWNYIHLNTTIRYPIRVQEVTHFFIGAGPALDILIDSKKFKTSIYEGYELETIVPGLKGELGYMQDWNNIRFGLNFSYIYDLNKTAKTEFTSLKNNIYQVMFSIGYRIK